MTPGDVRRRVERLEQRAASASPPDAMTIEEKAVAVVKILIEDWGRHRLPSPAAVDKLIKLVPPPDGVEWDRWRRALEEALHAAHGRVE